MLVGLLAVLSAAVLGSADFVGGMATKRAKAIVVVVWSNLAGLATALIAVMLILPGRVTGADVGWGVLAGLCGSGGAVLLYYALANGAMSMVAPTTAATAATLPLVVGVLGGDRLSPIAALGIAFGIAGIVLVSLTSTAAASTRRIDIRALLCALAAGAGFGGLFVLLAQTSSGGSLWPLVWARCATVPLLLTIVAVQRIGLRVAQPTWALAVLSGILDMSSTILYLLAVRIGTLSVVGVLASLYPVSTVLLARFIIRERIRPVQLAGVALAVGSVAMLASA